jgi:hypothetical protein
MRFFLPTYRNFPAFDDLRLCGSSVCVSIANPTRTPGNCGRHRLASRKREFKIRYERASVLPTVPARNLRLRGRINPQGIDKCLGRVIGPD